MPWCTVHSAHRASPCAAAGPAPAVLMRTSPSSTSRTEAASGLILCVFVRVAWWRGRLSGRGRVCDGKKPGPQRGPLPGCTAHYRVLSPYIYSLRPQSGLARGHKTLHCTHSGASGLQCPWTLQRAAPPESMHHFGCVTAKGAEAPQQLCTSACTAIRSTLLSTTHLRARVQAQYDADRVYIPSVSWLKPGSSARASVAEQLCLRQRPCYRH